MDTERQEHLVRFYSLLDKLEHHIGGARKLADCSSRMNWPKRGVYFFREAGEDRADTGDGPRIVRVGTHALKAGAATRLWSRLSQHRGVQSTGGGNHRGSIFRLTVGAALISRDAVGVPTWARTATQGMRSGELALERQVSEVIREMPFLWLAIEDDAGPESRRGYIERNSIALLSNYNRSPLDAPSKSWLGHHSQRERVRKSGLWNQNHVGEASVPEFLDILDNLVSETRCAA